MRPFLSAAVLAATLCAAGGIVRADLDVVIANGDSVRGTILPATETETFRVACPAGARFTASAKSRAGRARLALRLVDPDGVELDSVGGRKAKLPRQTLAASGEYRVVVGSADGLTKAEYTVAVAWKSPTRTRASIDVAAQAAADFVFAADAGAVVRLRLAAAKGSGAVPSVARITDSHGTVFPLIEGGAEAVFAAPSADTYTLTFENTADAAGAVVATARAKNPKPLRRALSATSAEIPPGTQVLAAAVIDARGGRVDAPDGGTLGGAGIGVPAGALDWAAIVVVGTGADLTPPKPAQSLAAAPSMVVGPFRRTFPGEPVPVVEISYLAAPTPPDGASLRVFASDTTDTAGEVAGAALDAATHTVSFAAPRLTRFQAFFVEQPSVRAPFVALGAGGDELGRSVAAEGAFVYAGAPGADGLGGEDAAGAIRIFERVGTAWLERATLRDPSPEAGARFGEQFALSHGTDGFTRLVVAAPKADAGADADHGAIRVFTGSGAAWTLETSLAPKAADNADFIGYALAADGDTIVASATAEGGTWNSTAPTMLYTFVRTASGWAESQSFFVSSAWFVPTLRGDEMFLPVTGDPSFSPARDAVRVYTRSAGIWSYSQTLSEPEPSNRFNYFGFSVCVDGDTLFAASRGVLPGGWGALYAGSRGAAGWTIDAKTDAPVPPGNPACPYGGIGTSLSLSGDLLAAMSNYFDPVATVYRRTSGTLQQEFVLDATPYLGRAGTTNRVGLSGTTVVVGSKKTGTPGGIVIYGLPE